jgi:hypothetical protein
MNTRIYFLILSVGYFGSCSSSETSKVDSKPSEENLVDSFSLFQAAFEELDFSNSTINFHHWNWDNPQDSTYFGQIINPQLLQNYTDTSFKIFEDDEYYAVGSISELNAYLIRSRSSEANYMQELFLFLFDDKNALTDSKKVASFYGAEGFINQSASWLSKKDSKYSLIMRNYNWSMSMPSGKEKQSEELRTYSFDKNRFKEEDTHFMSELEKKKYPFVGK